jgi:hypothetical protein
MPLKRHRSWVPLRTRTTLARSCMTATGVRVRRGFYRLIRSVSGLFHRRIEILTFIVVDSDWLYPRFVSGCLPGDLRRRHATVSRRLFAHRASMGRADEQRGGQPATDSETGHHSIHQRPGVFVFPGAPSCSQCPWATRQASTRKVAAEGSRRVAHNSHRADDSNTPDDRNAHSWHPVTSPPSSLLPSSAAGRWPSHLPPSLRFVT